MKKKILTFLSFIFMSFSMLTGCGGFIEDESLVIASITSEVLDDGRTLIIITYTDEEIAPSTFYLPKGETGDKGETGNDGNGIKEIVEETNPISGDITLTIYFTNEEMKPITYTLSNGVSITNITTEKNETTGNTYLIVHYSDGTHSEPFEIPKGEKGKNGNGIIGYDKTINEDGSISLLFIFSDGDEFTVDIPAPQKGVDGRGIKAIVGTETETEYVVTFIFTDDTEEPISFSKPEKPNSWLTGARYPLDSEGKNGDYYFDTLHNAIYNKVSGTWVVIIDFDDTETLYVVTFDVNADDADFPDGFGYSSSYIINRGTTFYSNNKNIPIPVRDGYNFMGWFTSDNPTAVHGAFTDLTPVYSDMILYAKWESKTA